MLVGSLLQLRVKSSQEPLNGLKLKVCADIHGSQKMKLKFFLSRATMRSTFVLLGAFS